MMEWRRRSRNVYGRVAHLRGRRYADALPQIVNDALDAVVAYHEEQMRYLNGGSSKARLERRKKIMRAAIARLEEI